jgi:hypothetical protein
VTRQQRAVLQMGSTWREQVARGVRGGEQPQLMVLAPARVLAQVQLVGVAGQAAFSRLGTRLNEQRAAGC